MNDYFAFEESLLSKTGGDISLGIEAVAKRYIGMNPRHPVTYRIYHTNGIPRDNRYRYIFDMNTIFPDSENESVLYAAGALYADKDFSMQLSITCFSPTIVYANGVQAFKSNIISERHRHIKSGFNVEMKKGYNIIVLRFTKIETGFGAILGPGSYKSNPVCFLKPIGIGVKDNRVTLEDNVIEHNLFGEAGFIYTAPMAMDCDSIFSIPKLPTIETDAKEWFPKLKYDDNELKKGVFERIFGGGNDGYAIAMSKLRFNDVKCSRYSFSIETGGSTEVFIGNDKVFETDIGGVFAFEHNTGFGEKKIIIKSARTKTSWGFSLETNANLIPPFPVRGTNKKWFFLGVFKDDDAFEPCILDDKVKLYGDAGFWRIDSPGGVIRPFNENLNYGKWNYPLGVTLYGLMSAAETLESREILEYAASHINFCLDTFKYALWDAEKYKASGIHNLLTTIDSLDDCGSFGSAVLELSNYIEPKNMGEAMTYVADYISNKQARIDDGTFVRLNPENLQHDKTIWADDLYMSVPFLCRYYKYTNDIKYLDLAAQQLLNQFKLLLRPGINIMSHVYDLIYMQPSGVSWGRGCGWGMFSFAELLEIAPQDYQYRAEILKNFKILAEGYLKYQDREGMWHQVIDDWMSYRETSCTSMFAYAYAKGFKNGWLTESVYADSAVKAWNALCGMSIDRQGNVYGVCRGSGFSFTKSYYMNELSWILNDTHGTGIVMLCGAEIMSMLKKIR